MYQGKKSIWQKHGDFILLDVLCLQFVYVVAYIIRHGWQFAYADKNYREVAMVMALLQISLGFFMANYKDILKRGRYVEAKKVFVLVSGTMMMTLAYLFLVKSSKIYSRAVILYTWVLGFAVTYLARMLWKHIVRKRLLQSEDRQEMVLVTTKDKLEKTFQNLTKSSYNGFRITAVCVSDVEIIEEGFAQNSIEKVKREDLRDYLRNHRVDGVFADLLQDSEWGHTLHDVCLNMGITLHYMIMPADEMDSGYRVEHLAGYLMNTVSIKFAEPRQLALKRVMDIAGAIVGLGGTGIITIIFGPIIFLQSPGPIFFSQKRVGKNGRIFKIYKFRSMYMDAEERKKELMKQNKMQGFMFKMDNDPRIIPIGHFMRKTSLDEFPQFWNVLKGDMSMVGTRPPTVDEYEQYEDHHKARLATKPGLTGMWQVSGRSDIVDFEEVVRLDMEYIQNWDIGLDLRILFQTVMTVFTGRGSV